MASRRISRVSGRGLRQVAPPVADVRRHLEQHVHEVVGGQQDRHRGRVAPGGGRRRGSPRCRRGARCPWSARPPFPGGTACGPRRPYRHARRTPRLAPHRAARRACRRAAADPRSRRHAAAWWSRRPSSRHRPWTARRATGRSATGGACSEYPGSTRERPRGKLPSDRTSMSAVARTAGQNGAMTQEARTARAERWSDSRAFITASGAMAAVFGLAVSFQSVYIYTWVAPGGTRGMLAERVTANLVSLSAAILVLALLLWSRWGPSLHEWWRPRCSRASSSWRC